MKKKFPAACDTWKSRISESKEATQKCISEKKKRVDEELSNGKSLLEDSLAREVTRRVSEAYPYVLLSRFHL